MLFDDATTLFEKAILSFIDNSHDFFFLKDKDFRYVFATKSFAVDCAGLKTVEDILGKTDFELFADQNLAANYRRDDERLFASGRSLREYREEYPSKNGRKRYCLTSKEILFDEDGNPAGILGTCRDITAQVEAERTNENQVALLHQQASIFEALRNAYNIIVYFDLEHDSYYHVAGSEYAKGPVAPDGVLSQMVSNWLDDQISPEMREACRKFCDPKTIPDRLGMQTHISREIYTKQLGWIRASLIPVNRNNNGVVTSCLWVSEPIAEEMATRAELENRLAILDALRSIYRVCLYWDLENDSYFTVSGTTFDNPDVVPDEGVLSEVVPMWLEHDLTKSLAKECKPFFDPATLPERLKNGKVQVKEIYTFKAGWLRTSIIPMARNNSGAVASCLYVVEDINDEKKREQQHREDMRDAKHAAETDSLTGLLNRGAGESRICSHLTNGTPGLMCMIDVDKFKEVNDQLGHLVGDEVLVCVAAGIRHAFRVQDTVSRFGGDEFVAFAPDITSVEAAEICLTRLIDSVELELSSKLEEIVEISIGALLIPDGVAMEFNDAYRMCDAAMYSCKRDTEQAYKIISPTGETVAAGLR